jgi:hypothetical protein
MGIDHVIKASRLIALLQTLPEGFEVAPNRVRNLAILNESGDCLGFIDLCCDEVEWFNAEG